MQTLLQGNQLKISTQDKVRANWRELPFVFEVSVTQALDGLNLVFTTLESQDQTFIDLKKCAFSIGKDSEIPVSLMLDGVRYSAVFIVWSCETVGTKATFTFNSKGLVWRDDGERPKFYFKPFRQRSALHRVKVKHFDTSINTLHGARAFRFTPEPHGKGYAELLALGIGEVKLFNFKEGNGKSRRVKVSRLSLEMFQGVF